MASTKNVLRIWDAIVGGNMATNITSPVTNVQFLDNISIQLNFTGTPVGTFSVEVSIDHEQDSQGAIIQAGNWVALPLDPTPVAAGAADQIILDLNQISQPWIRVVYTAGSGSGSLDMFISAKMI